MKKINTIKKILLIILTLPLFSLNTFSQAPNWAWSKSATTGYSFSNSIATDAAGNVYICGNFYNSTIFGLDTLTCVNSNSDSFDIFLVKYDPNGNVIWAKSAGGRSWDFGEAVTIDIFGNVYMTGFFWSDTISFGSKILTNPNGLAGVIYLAKYDSNGNVLWVKSAGTTTNQSANTITTDASGNVYIGGLFQGDSLTFGSTTLFNPYSINQISYLFIAKYDSSGNSIWAKCSGGSNDDWVNSIISDNVGNLYLTGCFQSDSITFGSTTLVNVNPDSSDVFLAKFDTSGNFLWAKSAGGASWDEATSLSIDISGNVYMVGLFQSSSITFGSIVLNNTGNDNIFIAKYSPSGNVLWAKGEGGIGSDQASSVTTDSYGNVYITGEFGSSTITFGSTTLLNNGNLDLFITKYDSSGNIFWAKSAGGIYNDYGISVTCDISGNVYLTGLYESPTIAFGSTILTNSGTFLTKINNNTGIINFSQNNSSISLYPNPTSGTFTLSYSLPNQSGISNYELGIYDILGQEVYSQLITHNSSLITLPHLSNGVYFYQLTSDKETYRGKFVKE